MGTLRRTCATVPRRGPLPKLLWADLLLVANVYARVYGNKVKWNKHNTKPEVHGGSRRTTASWELRPGQQSALGHESRRKEAETVADRLIACSHRRRGQDKTVLSCFVLSVSAVWTQFATVLSCLNPVSNCNCSVSNILRTTENLKLGNRVETRQNRLVVSPVVFTPPTRTRHDSFVLSASAVWRRYNRSSGCRAAAVPSLRHGGRVWICWWWVWTIIAPRLWNRLHLILLACRHQID